MWLAKRKFVKINTQVWRRIYTGHYSISMQYAGKDVWLELGGSGMIMLSTNVNDPE